MTLDPRHEENLRYVRERIAEVNDKINRFLRAEKESRENELEALAKANARLATEKCAILRHLRQIERHMTTDDNREWVNTPLAKGTFMEAVYARADHIAPDYGWQDDSPAYQEYVNQMAEVLEECVSVLLDEA